MTVNGSLYGPGITNEGPVEGKYRITKTIDPLWASPSKSFTCTATAKPALNLTNIMNSAKGKATINITVGKYCSVSRAAIHKQPANMPSQKYDYNLSVTVCLLLILGIELAKYDTIYYTYSLNY